MAMDPRDLPQTEEDEDVVFEVIELDDELKAEFAALIEFLMGDRPSDEEMKALRQESYDNDPGEMVAIARHCGCDGCREFLEEKGIPFTPTEEAQA